MRNLTQALNKTIDMKLQDIESNVKSGKTTLEKEYLDQKVELDKTILAYEKAEKDKNDSKFLNQSISEEESKSEYEEGIQILA